MQGPREARNPPGGVSSRRNLGGETIVDDSATVSAKRDRGARLMRAANILPLEEVELVHHATGERLTTFAEVGGSGEVRYRDGSRETLDVFLPPWRGRTSGRMPVKTLRTSLRVGG